jgi:multidrug resistance protein, MATE family
MPFEANRSPHSPHQPAEAVHHATRELTETIRLAGPMALTQLGQIAMMTTDLLFIGRLGDEAVAAAALAGTVYFVSFTCGMGLMSAVAPLAAQAFGAGDPRRRAPGCGPRLLFRSRS